MSSLRVYSNWYVKQLGIGTLLVAWVRAPSSPGGRCYQDAGGHDCTLEASDFYEYYVLFISVGIVAGPAQANLIDSAASGECFRCSAVSTTTVNGVGDLCLSRPPHDEDARPPRVSPEGGARRFGASQPVVTVIEPAQRSMSPRVPSPAVPREARPLERKPHGARRERLASPFCRGDAWA